MTIADSVNKTPASPNHVAIIMDGNGRWAKARGLSRIEGHRKGLDAAHKCAVACREAKISHLTLFAFSTDNWRRPENEIKELLDLFDKGLRDNFNRICEDDICIRFLGDLSEFPRPIRTAIDSLEQQTAKNKSLCLQIALNYSGRWDITEAVRRLVDTRRDLSAVDEQMIESQLATAGFPEIDLVIRTSGELRLSNFMLWQAAYSELYFTDVLWPDFDSKCFEGAIADYAQRDRRFGGLDRPVTKKD